MSFRNRIEAGPGSPPGPCRIGDVRVWANLTQFKVPYKVKPLPGKFDRNTMRQRSIFTDAVMKARDAFLDAGALMPIRFGEGDVKVQEYPDAPAVVFIFRRFVAGEEKLVPVKYDLGPEAVGFLRVTGRWPIAPMSAIN